MITCSDCGADVHDAVNVCASCGAPTPKALAVERQRSDRVLWNLLAALVVVAVAVGAGYRWNVERLERERQERMRCETMEIITQRDEDC